MLEAIVHQKTIRVDIQGDKATVNGNESLMDVISVQEMHAQLTAN